MYLVERLIGHTLQKELDLEMLVFEARGKLKYPEKNVSEQEREPTTNSSQTTIMVGGESTRHCNRLPLCTVLQEDYSNFNFTTYNKNKHTQTHSNNNKNIAPKRILKLVETKRWKRN